MQSEDQPDRMLLETRISREDGYQKQQGRLYSFALTDSRLTAVETLIVWTEQNGTDMALSFQEAEGCGVIWCGLNTPRFSIRQTSDITSKDTRQLTL